MITTEIGILNLKKKSLTISIKNAKCNYGHFRKVFPVAATDINWFNKFIFFGVEVEDLAQQFDKDHEALLSKLEKDNWSLKLNSPSK